MIRDLLDRQHREPALSKGAGRSQSVLAALHLEPLAAGPARRVLPSCRSAPCRLRAILDAVLVAHNHEPAFVEPCLQGCRSCSTKSRSSSTPSHRSCSPTPGPATNGTWQTWKRGALTAMCPWARKTRQSRTAISRSIRRRVAWWSSCRRQMDGIARRSRS